MKSLFNCKTVQSLATVGAADSRESRCATPRVVAVGDRSCSVTNQVDVQLLVPSDRVIADPAWYLHSTRPCTS
jgi:hypothetical protein